MPLAVAAVVGTVAGLAHLATVFWVLVWLVGRLPVPERLDPVLLLVVTAALAGAVLVARHAVALGAVLCVAAASGYAVALLPHRLKTGLKLALRAIGRSSGRTATTLVALFTGVFGIGLVLVLGQNISTKVDESISRLSTYDVFAIASPADAAAVMRTTASLSGVQARRVTADIATVPIAINDHSLNDIAAGAATSTDPRRPRLRVAQLTGVEGYDLAGSEFPEAAIDGGRALDRGDAGTTNALGRVDLELPPSLLTPGDTVTLQQPVTGRTVTLSLVGFYSPLSSGAGPRLQTFLQPVLADRGVTAALGPAEVQTTVALRVDPRSTAAAVTRVESAAPGATVYDVADLGELVKQVLGDLSVLMLALASLALLAGVVIIANAVALAMLERRREMGILKAVGHSSRSVLSQVLIENAVVAGIASVVGMAVVTLAAWQIGDHVLETPLTVGTAVALLIIGGVVAIVVLAAGLVAWGPTRVRALEALRYE